MKGLFIVFEGGDGVGKTTQVRHLAEWLREQGQQVLTTHEPGDTAVGLKLRQIVLDPATGDVDPRAEALLLAADKAQHLFEKVNPALASGVTVVCDRYVDSLIAYQGVGRELGAGEIAELARWATAGVVPDLTILMDVEPAQAVHRKTDRDRLEDAGAAFHQRVRRGFLALAEAAPERYLVLHARDELASNVAAVRARVAELMAVRA